MTVSTKTNPKSISIAELEKLKRAHPEINRNGRHVSDKVDMTVLELLNRVSQPVTLNEVHASLRKIGVRITSQTVRTSLRNLTDIGLASRRAQTDAERQLLGMTNGKAAYLYVAGDRKVPTRTETMVIPGIRIQALPDTTAAKSSRRKALKKKAAQARQARAAQTGTPKSVPARQGRSVQTGASQPKPHAIERHEIAITEMQERISSLEAALQNLQRILR